MRGRKEEKKKKSLKYVMTAVYLQFTFDWSGVWLYTDAPLICMTGMLISLTLPFKKHKHEMLVLGAGDLLEWISSTYSNISLKCKSYNGRTPSCAQAMTLEVMKL